MWDRDRRGGSGTGNGAVGNQHVPGKATSLEGEGPARPGVGKRTLAELEPSEIAEEGIAGQGVELPFHAQIQRAFGRHDISGIRAHLGDSARQASTDLGGRAYAYGDRIAFGETPDLHTAAHEAAHVIQQREGVPLKGGIDAPGDAFEVHADAVADAVVGGRSAEPILDRMAGAGRGAGAATPVVQRDTSKGNKPRAAETNPADLPPPPVGQFVVEVTTDGGYQFWFNTTEVKTWPEPLFTAMRYYMQRLYPGVSDAIVRDVMSKLKVGFEGEKSDAKQFPDNLRYRLGVLPGLHEHTKKLMRAEHPELRPHEIKVGSGSTDGGDGDGGEGVKELSGDEARSAEDSERAKALYERIRKAFPQSLAWQSDTPVYPEFLTFLADHAEELGKLPKGKRGAKAVSVDQLKRLLADFEKHQDASEGTQSGHADGKPGGDAKGKKDGGAVAKEGVEGGSQYGGAKDGSKYGWEKWDPQGEIVLTPKLDRYIAGSNVRVELKWDLSHAIHPNVASILLPNHCSYEWKVPRTGKKPASPLAAAWDDSRYTTGNSIFSDDRTTSVELRGQSGKSEIQVEASSRHFRGKTFKASVPIEVATESDFDKKSFDNTHVGDEKTFARNAKGKLELNSGQEALGINQELQTLDIANGGYKKLHEEGKISDTDFATLSEDTAKQRAALVEIDDKVKDGTPYIVRGTFVGREDSSSFELKLMMHMTRQRNNAGVITYDVLLHDLTMGEPTHHPGLTFHYLGSERPETMYRMLEGEALEAMAEHFHAHNDYPKGTVHLAVQRLTKSEVWEKTLDTNNWRKKAKSAAGTVAMVGGIALMVVPGGGPISTGLMVVSGVAGAAGIALELEDRIAKEGRLKPDRRLVMDVLQLASTVLSFGALTTTLREATIVGKTRFMLTMTGLDTAQGFMIAADTSHALRKIDAETAVKLASATDDDARKQIRDDRDRQVAEVLGGAIVSGGFLLVSLGGNIKHVTALTKAGREFTVREPIKLIAEGSLADVEAAIATQSFTHENKPVVMSEPETQYLEAVLMGRRATGEVAAKGGPEAPHERVTDQMPVADPEAGKPAAERTTQKMPAQEGEVAGERDQHPSERTTQKIPSVDPAVAKEPTAVSFAGKGDNMATAVAKITPEAGYFDVAVHSDAGSFYVFHDGSWVPVKPNSVRKWLLKQPGYHGQKIRLISCEAGANNRAVAQDFANGTRNGVKAATETLWVLEDGRIVIGKDPYAPSTGTWEDFTPYKKGEAVPKVEPAPNEQPAPRSEEPTPRADEVAPKAEEPASRIDEPAATDPIPADDELAPDLAGGAQEFGPKTKAKATAGHQSGGATTDALPPRKSDGKFIDTVLEAKYQDYRARKNNVNEHPRGRKAWKERVDWWKENSPIARGNKFNAAVNSRNAYTYHEVNLEDGTRLDGYEDGQGPKPAQRVSRKATNFLLISDKEFTAYVLEIDKKYPVGKKIRSNVFSVLDGTTLKGFGVLEVPVANLKPTDQVVTNDLAVMEELAARRLRFEAIAASHNIELRYTSE